MSNVYLKNRTASAITVAGYSVYYIDKTDAEIVEVEGADNITGSDDASGTISVITLPTVHSYTGVLFDSLRYYAKGTFSNTGSVLNAYGVANEFDYGTITWTDESLGDLSSKIDVNPPSSSAMIPQSVFKIIFITDSSITGYSPDVGAGQISDYTYNNGVHSITFYFAGRWVDQPYVGRIQFRYLDGVTTFNNLNAFDLISASAGSLSKDTTTDRYDMYNAWNGSITIHAQYNITIPVKYNAFKFYFSGVPYWYVIDGVQANWTDDLASIGYSEVQPVVLPEVTSIGRLTNTWGSLSAGQTESLKNSNGDTVPYDTTACYACKDYYGSGGQGPGTNRDLLSIINVNSILKVTASAYVSYVYFVYVQKCSSNLATVVPVYNSSNVAYNAFKFTASGTDYYYVLDGTQADWVSDLSSIGYSLSPIST